MHIAELLEIALANADDARVEVTELEPAEVSTEVVSSLAQLIAELVDNALAFSEPDDRVTLEGRFDHERYVVSVEDRGPGLPTQMIEAVNRMLGGPGSTGSGPQPRLGIPLVARLARRHGIEVRLNRGSPAGTRARATVPGRAIRRVGSRPAQTEIFASSSAPEELVVSPRPIAVTEGLSEATIDLSRYESPLEVPDARPSDTEVEEFLESIFAPLSGSRPAPGPRPARPVSPEPPSAAPAPDAARLTVRVPGRNFSLSDDEPSIAAGEAAVDIRKALSSYDDGRRSAES